MICLNSTRVPQYDFEIKKLNIFEGIDAAASEKIMQKVRLFSTFSRYEHSYHKMLMKNLHKNYKKSNFDLLKYYN